MHALRGLRQHRQIDLNVNTQSRLGPASLSQSNVTPFGLKHHNRPPLSQSMFNDMPRTSTGSEADQRSNSWQYSSRYGRVNPVSNTDCDAGYPAASNSGLGPRSRPFPSASGPSRPPSTDRHEDNHRNRPAQFTPRPRSSTNYSNATAKKSRQYRDDYIGNGQQQRNYIGNGPRARRG